ncbi:MAG: DNA topoisomerase (ATP-hydrolyzing) subunit B [Patescibacteria group bacterium]|nr:DNA topoisomerase (ATP-hydrolyzing) subunit B [Patescibacteria group bacterium]
MDLNKAKNQNSGDSSYTAKNITVLEGLEPVRRRPGMYIGGTGSAGLHHLIWEVADNAIDEAMAGFCDHIVISLLSDDMVAVLDNGRGIPVDVHKQTGKSALETVLTILHAGGKFGDGGYKVSGGLHGVGVSVVNALSTFLAAYVKRDNKIYFQEYSRGNAKNKISEIAPESVPGQFKTLVRELNKNNSGTLIIFRPDEKIFEKREFSWNTIIDHLRQQAYLTKKVKITINKDGQSHTFYFEGGIRSYVKHLAKNKQLFNDPPVYIEKRIGDVNAEISLAYVDDYNERVFTFANNIYTTEGGMHLTGFRTALTRAINDYAKKNEIFKNGDSLTGDDVREGLVAIISVKLKEPQFEGQTKAKLGNPEARTAVETVAYEGLSTYFGENPHEARKILEKCALSLKARLAAKAARETVIRKGALEGMTLPGKLADCSEKEAAKSELYIVEGDSAGGSAKQGRDRSFQAILPLRGKILNVERARLDRMLTSEEIKNLIIALGAGIGEEMTIEKIRYHRIIIMTDADVDGSHIRALLLTFFYRHMPEVISRGYLYIAQPPLYAITSGKEKVYAYSDEEKDRVIENIHKTSQDKINIQRYKGLGEMNPTQLWETTMDPQNRILLQVTVEEAERADEIFSMLMGDEVLPRKSFIQTHAKSVKNLDI